MRYLSICSGIEAASVAWAPLGWHALAFAEIDPFARAVLKHHYPDVPVHGDFTALCDNPLIADADVLVGGTPCQAFSVAGLRGSLSDERGNLTLEFVRLANAIDDLRLPLGRPPCWHLWENVPGVLSTKDNAFGAFLGAMCGLAEPVTRPDAGFPGAGLVLGPRRAVAWRILDAQFFGVPQRRRRVFVLARDRVAGWDVADALLPIAKSVQGHFASGGDAGQDVASFTSHGFAGFRGGVGTLRARGGDLQGGSETLVCGTLGARSGRSIGVQDAQCGHMIAATLRGHNRNNSNPVGEAATLVFDRAQITSPLSRSQPRPGGPCHTLASEAPPISFQQSSLSGRGTLGVDQDSTVLRPVKPQGDHQFVVPAGRVRRLTPVECERLQGFPDGYTAIPYRRKPADKCPDGPRYKAIGNSMAVPVMAYIGERIAAISNSSTVKAQGEPATVGVK